MPRQQTRSAVKERPRWGTLDDAAQHLHVSPKTIRRMMSAGQITGYRFGTRTLRIDLNELDALGRPIPTAAAGGGAR